MLRAFEESCSIEDVSAVDTQAAESPPRPQELFYEAGIVLGTTLGLVFGVDVLLTLLNVPSP